MKSHTVYRTFQTESRRELIRITEDVQAAVDEAGVDEGLALVAAMHITAAVWINDDEPGLHEDVLEWLDKVAPPSWKEPANDVARELLPDPGDYRHHRGGEDNGDAHLKNLLVHHQVIVPVTDGPARPGPVAAGLLLRVRRPPAEAADHQGARGVADLGYAVRHRSPRRPRQQVVDRHVRHPLARGVRGGAEVRQHEQVGRVEQRVVGRAAARGRSRRAPPPRSRPRAARATSAPVSTIGPRAVLTR